MLNSIINSKQSVSSQLGERRMSRLSGSSCHSRRNSKISISSAHSKRRNSRISERSKKRRTSHISSSSARRNSKISLGSKGSNSSKSSRKENVSAINMLSPDLKRQIRRPSQEVMNEYQLTQVAEVENEEIEMQVSKGISSANKRQKSKRLAKKRENLRATLMLIVVCALFLISEFPQFLLIIYSVNDNEFYNSIYVPLGDFLDVIVLTNGCVNFLLYCSMSSSFRKMFYSYFKFSKIPNPIQTYSVSNIFK
jgi:hypothetical protein